MLVIVLLPQENIKPLNLENLFSAKSFVLITVAIDSTHLVKFFGKKERREEERKQKKKKGKKKERKKKSFSKHTNIFRT